MNGVNKQHALNALGNLFNASQRTNMTYQEHLLCIKSHDVLVQFIDEACQPKAVVAPCPTDPDPTSSMQATQ